MLRRSGFTAEAHAQDRKLVVGLLEQLSVGRPAEGPSADAAEFDGVPHAAGVLHGRTRQLSLFAFLTDLPDSALTSTSDVVAGAALACLASALWRSTRTATPRRSTLTGHARTN
ncbi:hypothetical protein [Streptomyces sp. MST-110588]|uniref:hypothetical protein n=1 Tax=Streptomyces sp. MST-110588 TaxID=2833628 RepID=UPI001F5D67C5|nr:hypothetical protein [Streptomyces sp. MST-110588]UNO43442.1 hypothetical protein KGS77_33135 [Streptomyces sp. MST-110588]